MDKRLTERAALLANMAVKGAPDDAHIDTDMMNAQQHASLEEAVKRELTHEEFEECLEVYADNLLASGVR